MTSIIDTLQQQLDRMGSSMSSLGGVSHASGFGDTSVHGHGHGHGLFGQSYSYSYSHRQPQFYFDPDMDSPHRRPDICLHLNIIFIAINNFFCLGNKCQIPLSSAPFRNPPLELNGLSFLFKDKIWPC
jgi:hypothetical protein